MDVRAPRPARPAGRLPGWLAGLALLAGGCQGGAPAPGSADSPEVITDRAWRAHDVVVTAGERAPTCPAAGAAMQGAIAAHRQAFVDAVALDRDRARLAAATAYLEAQAARYADLEARMEALSDRCAEEPTVQAAFDQMASP